jgi:hypothetical protein
MATSTDILSDLLNQINSSNTYKLQVNSKGLATLLNLNECNAADIARVFAGCVEPTTAELQNIQNCCKTNMVGIFKQCGESWGTVAVPSVSAHHRGNQLTLIGVVEGDVSVATVNSAYNSFVQSNSGGAGSTLMPTGHLVWSNTSEENVVSLFVVKGDFVIALHFLAEVDPSFVPVTEQIPCEYEECLDDEEEDECEDECGLGNFHLLV